MSEITEMSVFSERTHYYSRFVLTIKLAPIFLRIKLNIKGLLELTPTCCERHLVLVEAVEHEDGDVEEHDGWMLTTEGYCQAQGHLSGPTSNVKRGPSDRLIKVR